MLYTMAIKQQSKMIVIEQRIKQEEFVLQTLSEQCECSNRIRTNYEDHI